MSFFSSDKTGPNTPKRMSLAHWFAAVLVDPRYARLPKSTALKFAIRFREMERTTHAPSVLAKYWIIKENQIDSEALPTPPENRVKNSSLHLPRRPAEHPQNIALPALLARRAGMRNTAALRRAATAQITATRASHAWPDTLGPRPDWHSALTMPPDRPRIIPRTLSHARRSLHLPRRPAEHPQNIALPALLHTLGMQGFFMSSVQQALTQAAALRVSYLTSETAPWRHEVISHWQSDPSKIIRPTVKRTQLWWRAEETLQSDKFYTDLHLALEAQPGALPYLHVKDWPTLKDTKAFRLSDLSRLIEQNPEKTAFWLLCRIHTALQHYNAGGLQATLALCKRLALSQGFAKALANIEDAWRQGSKAPIYWLPISLLLEAIGWHWHDDTDHLLDNQMSWMCNSLGNARQPTFVDNDQSLWITHGRVPYGWIGRRPQNTMTLVSFGRSPIATLPDTLRERLRMPGQKTHLVEGKTLMVPAYSADENALSQHTARLAHLLIETATNLLPPDQRMFWMPTLELVVDDLLFSTTREFWSLVHHLDQGSQADKGVFCETSEFAAAFAGAFAALRQKGRIQIACPASRDEFSSEARQLRVQMYRALEGVLQTSSADFASDMAQILDKTSIPNGPKGAALLVGRAHDRNYITDLSELGRAIRQQDQPAVFMRTATGGIKGQVSNTFEWGNDTWYSETFHQASNALWVSKPLDWALQREGLLRELVTILHRRNALGLLDYALLIVAHRRLEVFFGNAFLRHIKAAVLVSGYIAQTRPAYIALLPGRDFIARVAAVSGKQNGVTSFDVQTVFVGARSRYKPTLADVQLTIETESKRLFTDYFALPPERVVLSGCAKVGNVRLEGTGLSRSDVRSRIDLTDQFHIVFAGSPFLEPDAPIMDAVARNLAQWPDARLSIRLHPTAHEDYKTYCTALTAAHPRVRLLNTLTLSETLVSADVLVTRFSNVGMEAGLLGRDVIACNFTAEPAPIKLDTMGLATKVDTLTDLYRCLEDFHRHGPRWSQLQKTRDDYCKNNHQLFVESPSKSMLALIEDLCATRKF